MTTGSAVSTASTSVSGESVTSMTRSKSIIGLTWTTRRCSAAARGDKARALGRDYTDTSEAVRECFPVGLCSSNSPPETRLDYVRKLHPTSWSQFGKQEFGSVEQELVDSGWDIYTPTAAQNHSSECDRRMVL